VNCAQIVRGVEEAEDLRRTRQIDIPMKGYIAK
jgi:hypothetical protein